MAHPFADKRDHKVAKERVAKIADGYARGGAVKRDDDEAEDRTLVRSMVKSSALNGEGGKAKQRLDRPARAHGGKVRGKSGKTNVNVIVAGGGDRPAPVPVPAPAPGPAPAAAMPPRPPMLPPGGPPPGMPPRKSGGRAYARGGAVTSGPAFEEGVRNGTQVSHGPEKTDAGGPYLYKGPPKLTRKRGGKVLTAGADSGEGRLQKTELQKRTYP